MKGSDHLFHGEAGLPKLEEAAAARGSRASAEGATGRARLARRIGALLIIAVAASPDAADEAPPPAGDACATL